MLYSQFPPLLAFLLVGCVATPPRTSVDVLVYGGTASGVIASVAAAREGASVVLLEPGRHLGGMVSGGLGATDVGNPATTGGITREFFQRVGKRYGGDIAWRFEPHVAGEVLREMAAGAGVRVRFEHPLRSVEKEGRRIRSLTAGDGEPFAARVFIDASYEGDLMARAGVSYAVGREGRDAYGESLAGVRAESPQHQWAVKVSPFGDGGALLPGVFGGDPGRPGEGDRKVQAYNFRVCLTDRPDNRVPFPKPAGYDPGRYALLARYLAARPDLTFDKLVHSAPLPNGKSDTNNNGPFSTDSIGASWRYPEADGAERERIRRDHVMYEQGFFYFLANDPRVPEALRAEVGRWGLAKDEFSDTDHWPHQLYVREARRMLGVYVMTQRDIQQEVAKPDAVGMGSYGTDSHHVQRVPTPDGGVRNEGDFWAAVPPYEIPYRCLTPRAEECDNLLVPVCASASHVAYGTMRMEPVYMILGHAAGASAATAAREGKAVQSVDTASLRERLQAQGQVLAMPQ